jgi:hypothetical protein
MLCRLSGVQKGCSRGTRFVFTDYETQCLCRPQNPLLALQVQRLMNVPSAVTQKHRDFRSHSVRMFRVMPALLVDKVYLPKQHQNVGLCNCNSENLPKLGTVVLCMKFVLLSELLSTFVNLQKAAIIFFMYVCPSVYLSTCNNSAPTGRISMKFDIDEFPKICLETASFTGM